MVTRGLAVAIVALAVGVDRMIGASSAGIAAYDVCDGLAGFVQALTLSGEARTFYACTSDGTITAWDPGSSPSRASARAGRGQVVLAAAAQNAPVLAVAECAEGLVLWDLATGRRETLSSAAGPIRALAFSPDGATLAFADGAGVRLLDVASRRPLAGVPPDLRDVSCLAFSPDGRTLAAGCNDGMIHLRQTTGAGPSLAFRAHGAPVTSLAFASDGMVLASANRYEHDCRLWSVAGGRFLAKLDGKANIQTMAFAPAGRLLATAGFDGTVRVWDAATHGSERAVLSHGEPVTALAFSADGTTLACGGVGSILLYRIGGSSGTRSHQVARVRDPIRVSR